MENILKKGCVGCLLVIVGAFIFVFLSFMFFESSGNETKQNVSFEVTTKKGKVKLHLDMPKDSVVLLAGEPDEQNAHSVGSTIYETLRYSTDSNSYSNLHLEFENGKLSRFDQY